MSELGSRKALGQKSRSWMSVFPGSVANFAFYVTIALAHFTLTFNRTFAVAFLAFCCFL